jgi:uncharacterized protein YifE (UPF0438 family)
MNSDAITDEYLSAMELCAMQNGVKEERGDENKQFVRVCETERIREDSALGTIKKGDIGDPV